MAITLTQLAAFLAVVRRGSVTPAAEALVVTQPSVSAAVAALERELGVQLTERAGRGRRPRAAGAGRTRGAGGRGARPPHAPHECRDDRRRVPRRPAHPALPRAPPGPPVQPRRRQPRGRLPPPGRPR